MKTVNNRLKRKKRLQKKLQSKTKKKLRGGGVYTTNAGEWFVCDNPFCYQQYNGETAGFLTSISETETGDVGEGYVLITMKSKSEPKKEYKFKYKNINSADDSFFYLGKTETEKLDDSSSNYTYEVVGNRGNERLPLYYDRTESIALDDIPNLEPLMQKLFALIDQCPTKIKETDKRALIQDLVNSTGRYVCKIEKTDWKEYENYPIHETIEDLKESIRKLSEDLIMKLNEDLFNIYKSRGNILCYENKNKLCTEKTGELRQNTNTELIPQKSDSKKHLLLVDTKSFTKVENDDILYYIVLADLAINGIHNIEIDGSNIIFKQILTDDIYKRDPPSKLSGELPDSYLKEIDLSTDFLSDSSSSLEDILSKLYRSDLSLISGEDDRNEIYIGQFISELLTKPETEAGDEPEEGALAVEEQERIKAELSSKVPYFNIKCKLLGIESKLEREDYGITKLDTNAFNIHIFSIKNPGNLRDAILNNINGRDGRDKKNKTHICPKCKTEIDGISNANIISHMNMIQENKSQKILDKILNEKDCNKYEEQEVAELSEGTDKARELRKNAPPSMLAQAGLIDGMDKFIDLIKQQNLSQEKITKAFLSRMDRKASATSSDDVSTKFDASPEFTASPELMEKFRENEKKISDTREKIKEINSSIKELMKNTKSTWEREVKARGQQIDMMKDDIRKLSKTLKGQNKFTPGNWATVAPSSKSWAATDK